MPPRKDDTKLYRLFWRWHFFAAALVIPFVLWQSTTGTLYLWSQWWMDIRYSELRFIAPHDKVEPYATQVAAVLAVQPDAKVREIIVPEDSRRSTIVMLAGTDGLPTPYFVDPGTGQMLGNLTASQWLPGLSRALHAGWPLGKWGNGLLELGDCWAIVMLLTGLYLWWPRGRPFWHALWPRFNEGPRSLLRDLHSCIAVWFSAVFLFFLVSALPWTSFWGGQLLPPVQKLLGQESPVGFSPGGASVETLGQSLPSLDGVIAHARKSGIQGNLDIRLAPWPDAPWWVKNQGNTPGTDRYLLASPQDAKLLAELGAEDLPLLPRMIAVGVHVHQGDFGPVNRWLNTAFALSLIWLSITGFLSWWTRRPRGKLAAPPAVSGRWPPALIVGAIALGAILPLFGASVLMLLGLQLLLANFKKP